MRVEQSLRDNGCLPSFALHSGRQIVRTINARENILDMVQRSPRLFTRRMAYETKVDSRAALRRRIFAAAEQIKKPTSQHCLCYRVPEDTRRKLHSSWRRPLRTSTINQNDQLFNELLKNITLYSTTKNTVMRDYLSVEERLALTLRFLATGRALEDMKFSVTISPSAISQAVFEKCEVLMFSRIT